MRGHLLVCTLALYLIGGWIGAFAQPATETEDIINQYLEAYPFSPENAFRLATYLELKGNYDPVGESMRVKFGGLGELTFYPNSCLLRAGRNRVYSLTARKSRALEAETMNQALSAIFEQIFLLGNDGLNPDMVRFVDRNLARKNLGAFDKILLKHLMVRFGRFDSLNQRLELHTAWLPELSFNYRARGEQKAYKRPASPLFIKLDKTVLRGYYLRSGGTVYVEDVEREILYATGEIQPPNVGAFKLFSQAIFSQSTLYLVQTEQERLAQLELEARLPEELASGDLPIFAMDDDQLPGGESMTPLPSGYRQRSQRPITDELYHPYSWVPMLLGLLKAENVSVADPDILPYFVDQPYFSFMYSLLPAAEKAEVDRQLGRGD